MSDDFEVCAVGTQAADQLLREKYARLQRSYDDLQYGAQQQAARLQKAEFDLVEERLVSAELRGEVAELVVAYARNADRISEVTLERTRLHATIATLRGHRSPDRMSDADWLAAHKAKADAARFAQ